MRKQLQDKNLMYEHCDQITRRGLDQSRIDEWNKWKEFFAVRIVRGDDLKKLLQFMAAVDRVHERRVHEGGYTKFAHSIESRI